MKLQPGLFLKSAEFIGIEMGTMPARSGEPNGPDAINIPVKSEDQIKRILMTGKNTDAWVSSPTEFQCVEVLFARDSLARSEVRCGWCPV